MAAGRRRPEIRIVVDTNAIYTQSAHYLLKHEVFEAITSTGTQQDLAVSWHIPEVVRHERQYQMTRQAVELLPALRKIERLLGHNLAITDEWIQHRVNEVIERQITELDLRVLPFESQSIPWQDVMLSAAYRRPPFSVGEKEKGFRDALIAEAFLALKAASPTTARICRLVLITGDELLAENVRQRTADADNVYIFATLEELKGLINTLGSQVTEDFVTTIRAKATSYFFQKGDEDSLYYREEVRERIVTQHSAALRTPPAGATEVELGQTLIGPPRFGSKRGQRIHWVTRITIDATAYRVEASAPSESFQLATLNSGPSTALTIGGGLDLTRGSELRDVLRFNVDAPVITFGANQRAPLSYADAPYLAFGRQQAVRKLVQKGRFAFEIAWAVTVSTQRQSFASPTIEDVRLVDTTWEPAV